MKHHFVQLTRVEIWCLLLRLVSDSWKFLNDSIPDCLCLFWLVFCVEAPALLVIRLLVLL